MLSKLPVESEFLPFKPLQIPRRIPTVMVLKKDIEYSVTDGALACFLSAD